MRNILRPIFMQNDGSHTAVFSIRDLKIIEGSLPKRVISLVLEWAFEHRNELMENWSLAEEKKPLNKIEPLV